MSRTIRHANAGQGRNSMGGERVSGIMVKATVSKRMHAARMPVGEAIALSLAEWADGEISPVSVPVGGLYGPDCESVSDAFMVGE